MRTNLAGIVDDATAAAVQRPFLREFCKSVVNRSSLTDDAAMFDEMRKYFIDNAERVQSRDITFGAASAAAGNIGNGQILRLSKDEDNFDIETTHIDVKRAICVTDRQTGANVGQEVFLFRGQAPGRDALARSGSGLEALIAGKTVDDSLLSNAGFQSFDGTATAPTDITDWTSQTLAGADLTVDSTTYAFDGTNLFRDVPNGQTNYSLEVKADARLVQKLSVRGTQLNRNRPYLLAVVYNAEVNSATGTLLVRKGASSRQVTVTGQTGWQVVTDEATLGSQSWYKNFGKDDMSISLDIDLSGGSLLIGEVLFIPLDFFDGTWFSVLPASVATYTPFRYLDEFTFTDNAPTDSVVQKWLARGFRRYLPHSLGSSITFSNP